MEHRFLISRTRSTFSPEHVKNWDALKKQGGSGIGTNHIIYNILKTNYRIWHLCFLLPSGLLTLYYTAEIFRKVQPYQNSHWFKCPENSNCRHTDIFFSFNIVRLPNWQLNKPVKGQRHSFAAKQKHGELAQKQRQYKQHGWQKTSCHTQDTIVCTGFFGLVSWWNGAHHIIDRIESRPSKQDIKFSLSLAKIENFRYIELFCAV